MNNRITLETRRESNENVDKQKRYKQIIEVLNGKEMTAKEIAVEMYKRKYIPTTERNFSSPRITELLNAGVIECVGKKKCQYSNKTVSVFKIKDDYERNMERY